MGRMRNVPPHGQSSAEAGGAKASARQPASSTTCSTGHSLRMRMGVAHCLTRRLAKPFGGGAMSYAKALWNPELGDQTAYRRPSFLWTHAASRLD